MSLPVSITGSSTSTMITANAGCGKTFTLTNRVIGWMVEHLRRTGDPGAGGVLAATFTRKAAGEILHRMLRHLARGILEPDRLAEYAPSIAVTPDPAPDELIRVLEDVVGALGRMQVGTLDGLFNRVASAFAGEVGLPDGWSIGDAPTLARLRQKALDDLLSALTDTEIEQLAVAAEADLLRGGGHDTILKSVWGKHDNGLLDLWRTCVVTSPGDAAVDTAWRWMDGLDEEDLSPTASLLDSEVIDECVAALVKAPLPLTQKGTEHTNWRKACDRVVTDARDRRWDMVLANLMVQRIVLGEKYSKCAPTDEVVEALVPLIGHARSILVRETRARLVVWRGILHGLDVRHRARQREAGRYGFSDITDCLARSRVMATIDADRMAFRLDNDLRDVALDEFQDTSRAQFEILRPVLEELFAGAGSHESPRHLLIVADPKQSIYAWRGGTPALLNHVGELGGEAMQCETLARSWRSSPVIMDFVNSLFGDLDGNAALDGLADRSPALSGDVLRRCGLDPGEDTIDAVSAFRDSWRFEHHESARGDLPGSVQVRLAETKDGASIIEQVVEIARSSSGTGSMGILCPNNDQVDEIVEGLRTAGIDVSNEGSGAVTKLVAVDLLLDVLRLGDHPGHRAAAFRVSHSPYGDALGLAPLETIAPSDSKAMLADVSRRIRDRVLDEGLEGFISALAAAVQPSCDATAHAGLGLVARCAATWTRSRDARLLDFVAYVKDASLGEPSDSPIRVMTMHACKGLEFDEVVLPWLDGPLVKKPSAGCLPWSPGPLAPIEAVAPVLREELRMHMPVLEAFHHKALAADLADRLSLFYVAVTRARRHLHLILSPTTKAVGEMLTPATVLRAAIPEVDAAFDDAPDGHRGEIWSMHHGDASDDHDDAVPPPDTPRARPVSVKTSSMDTRVITPSGMAGEIPLCDLCTLMPGNARRDGVILHELFAAVGWLDDGAPDDAAIAAAFDAASIQLGGPIEPDLRRHLLERFNDALAGDAGTALRRNAHAEWDVETLDVLPEEPLLVRLEDGLLRGRIDRLVLGLDAGTVVRAAILDYKTGRVSGEENQRAAREHYAPQLERYARGVAALYGLDAGSVETGLLFIA